MGCSVVLSPSKRVFTTSFSDLNNTDRVSSSFRSSPSMTRAVAQSKRSCFEPSDFSVELHGADLPNATKEETKSGIYRIPTTTAVKMNTEQPQRVKLGGWSGCMAGGGRLGDKNHHVDSSRVAIPKS